MGSCLAHHSIFLFVWLWFFLVWSQPWFTNLMGGVKLIKVNPEPYRSLSCWNVLLSRCCLDMNDISPFRTPPRSAENSPSVSKGRSAFLLWHSARQPNALGEGRSFPPLPFYVRPTPTNAVQNAPVLVEHSCSPLVLQTHSSPEPHPSTSRAQLSIEQSLV